MNGIMKLTPTLLFLLVFVFCAPADPPCATTPCSESIKKIAKCPDEGCTRKEGHKFDQELDCVGMEVGVLAFSRSSVLRFMRARYNYCRSGSGRSEHECVRHRRMVDKVM